MFKITGKNHEEEETLTWDNGTVTGDGLAIRLLRIESSSPEFSYSNFIFSTGDHLADPLVAYCMMRSCFMEVLSEEGELPDFPRCPDGVIC